MDPIVPVLLQFDVFELNEKEARLTRSGAPVLLPPKAFAVLCTLARQPGQLVTKDLLLDTVWGHRYISESVLKTTISDLRAALGDDARQPRYIETASRRGYRFIGADIGASSSESIPEPVEKISPEPINAADAPPRMTGRSDALTRLREAWKQAQAGRRQLVWIAGEPGVGKTTLIENFLSELDPSQWVQGHCVEQFGAGEPYLPILEAMTDLCQRDPALVVKMRAGAPTWLMQMPWLCSEADRVALSQELAGANQERMVREARELFDNYSLNQPILLVTEDLHWTDSATLRLMDHFARRKNPARILWLCSFRLAEVVSNDEHPLKALRHELRLHKFVDEIVLDAFSEREVGDYLGKRFPDIELAESFVRTLHHHTDGLPLFLVNVIDDLVSQGVLQPENASVPDDAAIKSLHVPESLAGVIEKQISRLPAEVRKMLEVASVCGLEFRPQTIADAIDCDVAVVTGHCEKLARQNQWLNALPLGRLPDGSLDARYVFRHALYKHVLYQSIGALTQAQLHRSIAASLENSQASGVPITATELASHYELGHDWFAALRHYADAADSALKHFAPHEARSLYQHALKILQQCPPDAARLPMELRLVLSLGVVLSQMLGMGSAETRVTYERAEAICDQLPESPALGWALAGIGQARYAEGAFEAMRVLGRRVNDLTKRHNDPGLEIMACTINGMADLSQGRHSEGQQWLLQGIGIVEALGPRLPRARFPIDPGVLMQGSLAIHLVPSGLINQARQHAEAAIARGRNLGHPMAKCFSLRSCGLVEARLRQPERVAQIADELHQIASHYGIIQATGASYCLGGWAKAHMGDPDQGHARIREGCAMLEAINMSGGMAQLYCMAVDALLVAGRWDEAQKELEAGLALVQRIDERFVLPDLLLLQGRIAYGQGDIARAREFMQKSLAEARAQQALWFELSGLVALCGLDKPTMKDRKELAAVRTRVTEGLDTSLVLKADMLLA